MPETRPCARCSGSGSEPELTAAELGARLRTAITAAGRTQQAVAAAAGMDAAAMSRALAGQRSVSALELALICDTLGVSPLMILAPVPESGPAATDRLLRLLELDALLASAGIPARSGSWPVTLLDRAADAYIRGEISIRPLAGLLDADPDELLDQVAAICSNAAGRASA